MLLDDKPRVSYVYIDIRTLVRESSSYRTSLSKKMKGLITPSFTSDQFGLNWIDRKLHDPDFNSSLYFFYIKTEGASYDRRFVRYAEDQLFPITCTKNITVLDNQFEMPLLMQRNKNIDTMYTYNPNLVNPEYDIELAPWIQDVKD